MALREPENGHSASSHFFFLWKERWTHCFRCVLITVIAVFCTRTYDTVYKTNVVQGEIFTTNCNTSSGLASGPSSRWSRTWSQLLVLITLVFLAPKGTVHLSKASAGSSSFSHLHLLGWRFQLLFWSAGVEELPPRKASLSRCGKQVMKKNPIGSTVLSFWGFEEPFREQEQEL